MKDYDWEMKSTEGLQTTIPLFSIGFLTMFIYGAIDKVAWTTWTGLGIFIGLIFYLIYLYVKEQKELYDMRNQEKQNEENTAADKDENYTGNVKLNFKNLRY